MFATVSLDHTARIWQTATGAPLREFDQPGPVNNVAFSPDGRSLATLDFQGVIRILPACSDCRDSTALMAEAATRVTRQLTPAERRAFVQ
jgi:WD40 repeat protein